MAAIFRHGQGDEQSRRDRMARMAAIAGITYRLLDAALKLLIIPVATRQLGLEKYGVWLTANSLLSLLMVSDFGIGSGLINAVGGAKAKGDMASVRAFTASAYAAFSGLALALLVAVAGLAHTPVLSHWLGVAAGSPLDAESRHLFVIMGCLVASAALLNVVNFFAQALQEGYLGHVAQIGASIVSLAWILNLRSSSMASFALASALPTVAAYVALTVFMYFFWRPAMKPAVGAVSTTHLRVIWRDSSRLLVAQIADTVISFASNVLVASQLGSARVPEVSVSLGIMMIFSYVCCMFILPLWPAYVEAGVRGDWPWIRRAFAGGALRSVGGIVFCCLGYTLLYRPFLHTWSPALPVPSLGFVLGLGLWFVIYVWNKNSMVLLNGLGHTRVRALVAPLSAAVFIGSALLLLPAFGVLAIPFGGIASALVEAVFTSAKAFELLSTDKSAVFSPRTEVGYATEV